MPYFGIPIRNGLPIGLGSVAGFGIAPFSPESLFENGEVGAWYDPSDYSTLFTDSAGTTPVSAPGNGSDVFVGLMLDKSQGLVLGPELVTNGDFSSGTTGWTGINATLAVVGGAVEITATVSGQARASQAVTTVSGRWYEARATIWQGTGAVNLDLLVSGIASSAAVSSTTPTAVVVRFLATSSSTTIRVGSAGSAVIGTTFFADNISVRELPGNHAFQTSSAKRPKLAARYNLLTYSEEFDNNTAWTKGGGGVTADATTSPIGTLTADLFTSSIVGDAYVRQTTQQTASTQYRSACYFKSGTNTFGRIRNLASGGECWFDLTNGTVGTQTSCTGFIENSGNGWYLCSIISTTGASIASNLQDFAGATANGSRDSNSKSIYIWGADLRPASQATGLIGPTYQRVAAATVYDTAGFLPYLAFDGLDDSMETSSIVPGTDKVQVFAGVRKLSSLDGIIAELSADRNANNGTWTITQNPLNTPAYFFASKGTSSVSATSATNFSAPITNVLTGIGDISGDVATLRVDGVQVATGTADQGTGNYLTYPLYIGCRFNNPPGTPSSIFFNGNLSSLIVRFGPNLSTSTIQATESWVAGKTGVSI